MPPATAYLIPSSCNRAVIFLSALLHTPFSLEEQARFAQGPPRITGESLFVRRDGNSGAWSIW